MRFVAYILGHLDVQGIWMHVRKLYDFKCPRA